MDAGPSCHLMEGHHCSMAGGHHSTASSHHSTAGGHHSMASASGTGLLFSRERDARAVFGCHRSPATSTPGGSRFVLGTRSGSEAGAGAGFASGSSSGLGLSLG